MFSSWDAGNPGARVLSTASEGMRRRCGSVEIREAGEWVVGVTVGQAGRKWLTSIDQVQHVHVF
jgi:hypothetical protein